MNDFSNLNHLPTDLKLLIINGQNMVDDAKEKLQSQEYFFDLTSKMQLKSDCKQVEKYIKLISKGKKIDKNKKCLELSIVCLQTTVEGLIKFYTR